MKAITVLAGRCQENIAQYTQAAIALGREIARRRVRLVVAGAGQGLLQVCAETAHQHGGEVEVVIPGQDLATVPQPAFARVTTVANAHMQRQAFLERSAGIIALPGDPLTTNMVASLVAARDERQHAKPVVALAPDDFWTPMHWQFESLVRRGRMGHNHLVCSPLPHVAVQIVLGP